MSILFTCPRCGKQTTVADEFAGHSEPCAACGETITITPSGEARSAKLARSITLTGLVVVVLVFLATPLLPFLAHGDRGGSSVRCRNNLHLISIALFKFESVHRGFSTLGSTEKDGQPTMSWRVAILPYLDRSDLFKKYDHEQSWNSPKNHAVASTYISVYKCPSDPKGLGGLETSYVMLAGKGTVAGLPEKDRNLEYISAHSGLANTILVIEVPDSGIPWAESRDLTINEFIERIESHKGGNHPDRINVVFCDGSVDSIRDDVSPDVLRALANPNRDGPVDESQWKR